MGNCINYLKDLLAHCPISVCVVLVAVIIFLCYLLRLAIHARRSRLQREHLQTRFYRGQMRNDYLANETLKLMMDIVSKNHAQSQTSEQSYEDNVTWGK